MRIIDLTLPITGDMPSVQISTAKQLETDGWNATTLSLYSHCGTHMDAPRHFLQNGDTIDQQRLDVCVGPATVVNLAPVAPRQLLTVDDFAVVADRIQPGTRLLIRTDWHKQYGQPEYRDALPRVSPELAKWLVRKQVALLGVEPPSVADVNNMQELTEVHQTLFRGGVLIIEGLANLDQISSDTIEFIGLPLHVVNGDGCPVRAIAIEK